MNGMLLHDDSLGNGNENVLESLRHRRDHDTTMTGSSDHDMDMTGRTWSESRCSSVVKKG